MDNPLLSIITPTYNRASVLERCIKSVLIQRSDDYEHVIIDDGSTDDTATVINEYKEVSNKIVSVNYKDNRGVNYARNRGIENATGTFLLFLDSDDRLKEGALKIAIDKIRENPNVSHFVFKVSDRSSDSTLPASGTFFTYRQWLERKISGDFTHVVKTSVMKKYKFFEEFSGYESLNMLRVYRETSPQLFVDQVVCDRTRNNQDSLSSRIQVEINKDKKILYKYHLKYLKLYAKDLFKHKQYKCLFKNLLKCMYYLLISKKGT